MSDGLNQVGRYIKTTEKRINKSLRRYFQNQPYIERTRDIFDSEIFFEMSFDTIPFNSRMILDLTFHPPPPSTACTDCYCSACEQFIGERNPVVTYGYLSGSVVIFINDEPTIEFTEVSSGLGQISMDGLIVSTDKIVICYVYQISPCI